jgi:hypothetical protein
MAFRADSTYGIQNVNSAGTLLAFRASSVLPSGSSTWVEWDVLGINTSKEFNKTVTVRFESGQVRALDSVSPNPSISNGVFASAGITIYREQPFDPIQYTELWSTAFEDLQLWTDLTDAIEQVFKVDIQDPTDLMLSLRYLVQYDPEARVKANPQVGNGTALIETDKRNYERSIIILAANLLGFTYQDSRLLDDSDYRRIHANIGAYYPEKGTENFISFFGFCANAIFDFETLWSDQVNGAEAYGNFYSAENSAPSGQTSITAGGSAFPTTHVGVSYDLDKYGTLDPLSVYNLAKFLSPINLVFHILHGTLTPDPSILGVAVAGGVDSHFVPPKRPAWMNWASYAQVNSHVVPPITA